MDSKVKAYIGRFRKPHPLFVEGEQVLLQPISAELVIRFGQRAKAGGGEDPQTIFEAVQDVVIDKTGERVFTTVEEAKDLPWVVAKAIAEAALERAGLTSRPTPPDGGGGDGVPQEEKAPVPLPKS